VVGGGVAVMAAVERHFIRRLSGAVAGAPTDRGFDDEGGDGEDGRLAVDEGSADDDPAQDARVRE
jgi:hypothetical protein